MNASDRPIHLTFAAAASNTAAPPVPADVPKLEPVRPATQSRRTETHRPKEPPPPQPSVPEAVAPVESLETPAPAQRPATEAAAATVEFSDQEPAPPDPTPVLQTGPLAADEFDIILAALIDLIEKHKTYPRAALRARLEGVVLTAVMIDSGGRIAEFNILQTSGHAVLDHATRRIFDRIAGSRVAAEGIERALEIVVPIRYARRP